MSQGLDMDTLAGCVDLTARTAAGNIAWERELVELDGVTTGLIRGPT